MAGCARRLQDLLLLVPPFATYENCATPSPSLGRVTTSGADRIVIHPFDCTCFTSMPFLSATRNSTQALE